MIRWIPYTFVRVVIFLIAGILLGIYSPDIIPEVFARIALAVLALLYLAIFFLGGREKFNPGFAAWPAVFLAGYVHMQAQTDLRLPDHFINRASAIEYYQVVITKFPEEKEKSWKLEGEIKAFKSNSWRPCEGRVVLYFSKDDFSKPFDYGDVLMIKNSPELLKPPANPGEFDYQRFLAFKNIYHQHFLREGDVIWIENKPPNIVMAYAIKARLWADATLKRFVPGEREQAIASALVLGVTDGLDNELLSAYAATGAMHVLAVSGLHISIIYLIIVWLLRPLNKFRSGPWTLAIISLLILWTYAFITGLSPSVLRAVTMFSFIAIARPWSRHTNIYNTLAASAFCLLLYDPHLIMSVGFQLSYLAVIGIVYLQPRLYALWETDNRFLNEVWKITCVSLAAQVATFSLGLLYFHQFPNYFLISNLLVIPISFVVLVLGLAVLAASFMGVIASALGVVLGGFIWLLNFIVFTVDSWPFSLIENIYITTAQCWLLMAMVMAFLLLIEYKKFSYAVTASVLTIAFVFFQWMHFAQDVNQKKITIYKVPGHRAIDFIDQGQAWFVADSALSHNTEKLRFHIQPNRLIAGVQRIHADAIPFMKLVPGGKLISWNGKTMLIIDQTNAELPPGIHPDILVISNNAVSNLEDLLFLNHSTKIIVDSSNSYYHANRLLEQGKVFRIGIYSVLHHGAFDLSIDSST